MGAVLGRASPFQLIIITFFELIFYSANEALNIYVFRAADVGGSMIIHTFGAYFGIAVSLMLYRKRANDHPKNSTVYHSDLFAMIGKSGATLVWPCVMASGPMVVVLLQLTLYRKCGSCDSPQQSPSIVNLLCSCSISADRTAGV